MANGEKFNSSVLAAYGASFTTNDVIGIALDMDAGTITFYKNGASQGQAYSGITGTAVTTVIGLSASAVFNFGQRPFAYTAHSGFKALCTTNLPEPTIADGSTVMDVVTYTGNGSTQTISGLNFSPDLVWIKYRNSGTYGHVLFDQIRGATNWLSSNSTIAEFTDTNSLTTFNSSGFALGAASTVNENTGTYVAWACDAGSSTVTNTEGSITSQVRANASAGFSIVTATCASGTNSYGHGLGVKPSMYIVKNRDVSQNWQIWHQALSNETTAYLQFNTSAQQQYSTMWAPSTSTTISLVSDGPIVSGDDFVAYCFAPVAGYSSFGSYTGNGSADGPFVYNNFLPKLILIKRTDTTSNWTMLDTSREGYNVDNDPLYPNLSNAEGTTDLLDINSNGFKLRTTDASVNANTGTYVYAAWASNPFQYSRAR